MFLVLPARAVACLLAIGAASRAVPGPPDQAPLVRRLAATAKLGAQEYRNGVRGGRVVAAEEVEEARLFLGEARRTAALLPPELSRPTGEELEAILSLVEASADPDSVEARVARLSNGLATRLGLVLDEIPASVSPLARGAEIFQQECASCHGAVGRGDGPAAAGLTPPPADLTDYRTLLGRSPLDFYHKVTLGVVGTAMPGFETRLGTDDRWAVTIYASLLRLRPPRGEVPTGLRALTTTASMSDSAVGAALEPGGDPSSSDLQRRIAAVRAFPAQAASSSSNGAVFSRVRQQLDSAVTLATHGEGAAGSRVAFDAYMTFEQVEHQVRASNGALADQLEADFAALRTRAAGGATAAELDGIRHSLLADLENAERRISDRPPALDLFVQSFMILLREGLEAILILGAVIAVLVKTGAGQRRRDVHVGVGAAVFASLVTAAVFETVVQVSHQHQEALEGITMLVATAMLFYVSYWLLSKLEVAKWNRFVRIRVEDAVSSGSALALASVAFLAVYREGFETVLFYQALLLSAAGSTIPVLLGIAVGALTLGIIYLAINRYGIRIPLKPFFGVTSVFLYYMAFVFAGKGVAELQEGGIINATVLSWAPRLPSLGIYPTRESLSLQALLLVLLVAGLIWTFVLEPRRMRVTRVLVPESPLGAPPAAAPPPPPPAPPRVSRDPRALVEQDMVRSLERMDADLAELRAEVERLKGLLQRAVRDQR
jgi:high-affinity iron transporter